ncbi:hypothetical protein [Streptomyces sp. NPDC001401]|uniref:hypothetical protein n=1 Tax=Streptomyces sp. NPDC001401 TaxID=3364570 RepID=UPI0036910DAF
MHKLFDYFKHNPELFGAYVALIALFVGFFGTWLAAWLQARSGNEQANAARDAARITAQAERLAALRVDRRVEIAAFVRLARETFDSAELMFRRADEEADLKRAYAELTQKQAEIELIAPPTIVGHAEAVVSAVERVMRLVSERGAAARAHHALAAVSSSAGAHRVRETLNDLRTDHEAGRDEETSRSVARYALFDVSEVIDDDGQRALLLDATLPPFEPLKTEAVNAYAQALRQLIDAARAVLRSDDA